MALASPQRALHGRAQGERRAGSCLVRRSRIEIVLVCGPHSAYENVKACIEWGVPVVSGSTGWTERLEELKKKCTEKNGAFAYSSNYSIGVNIFFELNKKLASLMAEHLEYEVLLEETHHTQKKDAPSGTAISLAEQVLEFIKSRVPDTTFPIIMLTAFDDPANKLIGKLQGRVFRYLTKPFAPDVLVQTVREAMAVHAKREQTA